MSHVYPDLSNLAHFTHDLFHGHATTRREQPSYPTDVTQICTTYEACMSYTSCEDPEAMGHHAWKSAVQQ